MNQHRRPPRGLRRNQGQKPKSPQNFNMFAPVKGLLIGALKVERYRSSFSFDSDFAKLNPSPGLFFQRMVLVYHEPRWNGKYSEIRSKVFQAWIDQVWQQNLNLKKWRNLCSNIHGRMKNIIKQLKHKGWSVRDGILETADRLVVGLGQTSFWEVGMTWHRPTGLPYVPASALKGITRAKALEPWYAREMDAYLQNNPMQNHEKMEEWVKGFSKAVNRAMDNILDPENSESGDETVRRIRCLFGIQDEAGQAVFLDAFPVAPPQFTVDIMNVHYPSYYQGEGAADDTENPNPITFLAIEKGSLFYFAVAVRTGNDDAEWLWQQLTDALAERGVGSKTRLGYGRFKIKKGS